MTLFANCPCLAMMIVRNLIPVNSSIIEKKVKPFLWNLRYLIIIIFCRAGNCSVRQLASSLPLFFFSSNDISLFKYKNIFEPNLKDLVKETDFNLSILKSLVSG